MKEFEHVIILLDGAAPSFCYYPVERMERDIMPEEILRKVISFCRQQGYYATVAYGNEPPGEACMKLLADFPHTRIIPLKCATDFNSSDIYTADFDEFEPFLLQLKPNKNLNIILRMNMDTVLDFTDLLERYWNRFKRLNVIFRDVTDADETDLNTFRLHLVYLNDLLFNMYTCGKHVELNFVTDRMLHNEMNNCNAGATHFTIAPTGAFYVCPGFYHTFESSSIGSLDLLGLSDPVGLGENSDLPGLENPAGLKNRHLYGLEHAVICSICDCFHCKRCVYLNKKTTFEVNTPSHQQCVTSHHERNLSGMLLNRLKKRGFMNDVPNIEPLFYTDPYEVIKN